MPRAAKRVSFGSVTPLSASPIEDSEGIDLLDSSRLLDAPPSHPWMHGSTQVATVSAATPPLVHNAAGDLLGVEEPNKYAAQPALFRGSWADGTHAPLSSARQAAHDVRVDNRRGGDIQEPKAEAPPRGTPASSPSSRRGSSDDDT
ncbi:hypothetical protein GH5_01259 [Leishmania sp. Ghana 2012 LV757]|uniref:hypothetical protein n=1 Tax=Leishmania sp. Ghana 2012 LV757 TaxID=2803181 RepID=UPI001B5E7655|nr:hypothetical protein GH5_01259 [Leishmania sp. Ghana 2012 LV757]